MLLTITTTRAPATDLGFLLHKHPARVQSFGVSSGTAHVFYPEATGERCTAALLLEVDPVGLVRGPGDSVTHYVNDRPYAASSLLAVALKEVFRTALTGRCEARPELAATAIPLLVRVPALRCAGGPDLAGAVFGPLGWDVSAGTVPLDPPSRGRWGSGGQGGWGAGARHAGDPSPRASTVAYLDLRLAGTLRLADALNHLYVLLPVLDDAKHYWVATDEVDKLVRAGAGWLSAHPERGLIIRRYLAHRRELTESALARLAEADDLDPAELDNAVPDEETTDQAAAGQAEVQDKAVPLAVRRREAVLAVLRESGARTVGDLGCGDGALTAALLRDTAFGQVVATDVSARALRQAARRLKLDWMPPAGFRPQGTRARRARLQLFQSSLSYRDERLAGLDAAVLMEVIEHVDPGRLAAVERAVFGFAAPGMVVVTTPNREHNAEYGMPDGALRHRDHRFEWTRAEFAEWASRVASAYRYDVRFLPVGPSAGAAGPPTQMAVFTSLGGAA